MLRITLQAGEKKMKKNKLLAAVYCLLFIVVFISALILPIFVFGEDLEKTCQEIINSGQKDLSKESYQALLKKCQDFYEEQITEMEKGVNETGAKKATLENQIYSLNKKIKNLDYQIYQSNLVIKDIGIQIEDTEGSITKTSSTIEESKVKLANILRNINEEDQKSTIEILFSENDISGFFNNLVALEQLSGKSKELLQDIKTLKVNLEGQKISLGEEKDDLELTVKIQTLQKGESAKTKSEQEYYWGLTEQEYQKQLKEKQETEKKAAEIRARIFELAGVIKPPTFGEAYEIAKYVKGLLGVRPAFLLAVLQQESAIGKNVGQCYLKNSSTGDGIIINSGRAISRVMKPSRDVVPFLTITKELGRDPYITPVSCPMSFGYGGAMGPAQFIPSTWALYKNRLKSILGRPCDPWNIQDSFVAAGLYLADGGAAARTRNSEWRAAMIYFSGSTTNPAYYWYANQVLVKADSFQRDIEALEATQ